MSPVESIFYVTIFLFGIVIGSFLNVCIYRIPKKESIVSVPSHCMKCGHRLAWYELIPLFSYIFLQGRCRGCKEPISIQYPMIEFVNGVLYIFVFTVNGMSFQSVIYCLFTSALLVLSVIDWRTFEIPVGINIFILFLGVSHLILDFSVENLSFSIAGFFAVSLFLYLLYLVSGGRAIGGGDIKLMAVSGLLLGPKRIVLAFLLGCLIGSAVHILRMKIAKAERVLALGPYLSVGCFIAMLYGNTMIDLYLKLFE